jgi:thymidylate kinase
MVEATLQRPPRSQPTASQRHAARFQALANVIAIVGCDGAGKSTLAADLLARLRDEYPVELLYLGQDSGNILRWILGVPLIGPAVGRYLLRKSARAHPEENKPASPDALTALVIYVLSRWRRHKFRRMLALDRRGIAVIADRYPQAEVPGFHFDGPGLAVAGATEGLVGWLAARETRLYQTMADHVPALLIRLNVDAETAHVRKPDHKLPMLRDKARVIPTLTFNGARIVDLDARAPYPQVLEAALAAARTAITTKAGAMHPG